MRTQCESSTGLNIERILIDPETAKKLLKGNVSNRPFSRPWALQLSNAMERGEWKENGDTISFDEKGNLFDGQHRLFAIVLSGITQPMIVVRNVPRNAFDCKDIGKRRNMSDVLAIKGFSNNSRLAATVRIIKLIECGYLEKNGFSHPQLEEVLERHPLAIDIVAAYKSSKAVKFCTSALPAVVTIGSGLTTLDKGISFIDGVATGEGLLAGDSRLFLRERFLESALSKTRRMLEKAAVALTIKAWNAYVSNKRIGVLRYGNDEAFPLFAQR